MKSYKHLLISSLLLFTQSLVAEDFTENGIRYSILSDTEVKVVSNEGLSGTVTIPSSIRSYSVVAIEHNAFENNTGITSVFIPSTVRSIGYSAFYGCAHKSGHRRDRERPGTTMADRSDRKSSRSASRKSKIVNKRSSDKLEGSQIFERYGSAVFMVFTTDGSNAYQGSGFFIDNEGLAVSNYHVFKGTGIGLEQIKLVGSDEAYKVTEVIQKSEQEDFILFRVDCENTNYIPIATDKPKIGEKVYAIGSPHGLENTFSSGEVSQWRADNLMQISALIDHGSSGGALINEYGEVVGITSGSFADGSQANLNYAWSIDAVKPYIKIGNMIKRRTYIVFQCSLTLAFSAYARD